MFRVRPVTRCSDTLQGHSEAILHVSFSPDGKKLASGGGDATVRFWDTNTCLPKHTGRGHKHHVLCTAWSPDGERFASADRNGEIRLWDPTTGKQAGQPLKGHKFWVNSLAWEPMHRYTFSLWECLIRTRLGSLTFCVCFAAAMRRVSGSRVPRKTVRSRSGTRGPAARSRRSRWVNK